MENRELRTESPDVLTDERRQWARFLSSVGEVVLRPSGAPERRAIVVDESFGGIGLVADDASGLVKEAAVDVIYDGALMFGVVKYVCPTDDGRFRVGLQWQTKIEAGGSLREKLEQFESRLFALFRLLEIGDWDGLQMAATQLEQDAQRLNISTMGEAAANLRTLLEHGASKRTISTALERLVDVGTDVS